MKPKVVCVGMLDASTVTREGYRKIVIDLWELDRNLKEMRHDANIFPGTKLRLRVEHNGCSDSNCHECGGGGLDVMVEYERGLTEDEVLKASHEMERRSKKAEAAKRRLFERLKKRYEG